MPKKASDGGSCAVKKDPVWQPCEKSTTADSGSARASATTPGWNGSSRPEATRTGVCGQRPRVGDRVVRREVGRRCVRARVGPVRLRVLRPYGRADGGDGCEQAGVLLGQQQRAVPTHRDAHGADALRCPPEVQRLAHRDQLPDHHLHRVVMGMRVPVAAAAVDGHHGHRRQRDAVDLERDGLRRRHGGQRVRVVGAEAVEHDDERQGVARMVTRRPGDGVADRTVAGPREEGPGPRGAWFAEAQRRCGDRARPVELVELLFPRKDAVLDQLEPGGARDSEPGEPAEDPRQDAAPAPAARFAPPVVDVVFRDRHAVPSFATPAGQARAMGGVPAVTRAAARPATRTSSARAASSTTSIEPMWKRLRGPGPPSTIQRAAPVRKTAVVTAGEEAEPPLVADEARREIHPADDPGGADDDGADGDGAHEHPGDLAAGELGQRGGMQPVRGHEEGRRPGVRRDAAGHDSLVGPRMAPRARPAVGEVVGPHDENDEAPDHEADRAEVVAPPDCDRPQ